MQKLHTLLIAVYMLLLSSFPGSPSSASVCNMIFDPVKVAAGSKVILCTLVEEGKLGNEVSYCIGWRMLCMACISAEQFL